MLQGMAVSVWFCQTLERLSMAEDRGATSPPNTGMPYHKIPENCLAAKRLIRDLPGISSELNVRWDFSQKLLNRD